MPGLSLAALREALKPTPAKLTAGMLLTVAASLLWGVSATFTVVNRISAANDLVAATGPLSLYTQRIYQSLSDADATEAAAFLAVTEPPAARAEFHADIERAGTYLQDVTAADPSAATKSDLTTLETEVPEYTLLIGQAKADSAEGLPVGASYLQEASYLMRSRLLPAADDLYRQENARLANSYARATGFPLIAMIVAVMCAISLFRLQRWLASRTHRTLNRGLAAASVIGALSLTWLLVSFFEARTSLTLINRSGDDANEADFKQAEKQLGPGNGTLLSRAKTAGIGSPGYGRATAAESAATAWYAVHRAVRKLDDGSDYPAAVYLAIGSGAAGPRPEIGKQEAALTAQAGPGHPATSAAAFADLEAKLTRGINADYGLFAISASRGDGDLGGLAVAMAIASLLMAAACARGLTQRIAEYR